ncbi:hypothetical protein [Algoriphagus sp.]|uniref:hypothetical protein n=1 Tax=Algoriphagus sp. TaxID=1872435 RepID=UPI003F72291F
MPKVLIFGQSFNSNTGGGVTLSNLFSKWDKKDLAVVCTSHANGNITKDCCDNYYFIGSDELKWKFPFRLFQRRTPSGKLPIIETSEQGTFTIKPTIRNFLIFKVLAPFLHWSGLQHVISYTIISPKLLVWIRDFAPDVLYVQVTSREATLFATALTDLLKIPMVIHQMDDWLGPISSQGLAKNYWASVIDMEFKKLARKAALCMSIGDYMGEEYQKRYGVKFHTFHNPVELDKWMRSPVEVHSVKIEYSVLYAGRTGFGIDASLRSFANAVELFNQTSDLKINFYVQTAEELQWTDAYSHTFHRKLIPYDELPELFQRMDFLLMPCDFSASAIKYLKYSMPTKAPEYMASGTPIIILSPEQTAIFQYGQQNRFALMINEDEPEMICRNLKEFVFNEEAKVKNVQRALELAKLRHAKQQVAQTFYEQFQKIAYHQEALIVSEI